MILLHLMGCLALQEPPEGANLAGPWVSVATSSYDEVCGVNTVGSLGCIQSISRTVEWHGRDREFVSVDGGSGGWCAIDIDGELLCGGGLTAPSGEFETVSVGYKSACATDEWGNATCIGDGNNGNRLTDVPNTPVRAISLGYDFGVAVLKDGTIQHWGTESLSNPDLPANNTGFFDVAASFSGYVGVRSTESVEINFGETEHPGGGRVQGAEDTYCLLVGDDVSCFGANNSRQADPPSGAFSEIDVGDGFACGINEEQRIECWGDFDDFPFEG
jgi:hypothetical protein